MIDTGKACHASGSVRELVGSMATGMKTRPQPVQASISCFADPSLTGSIVIRIQRIVDPRQQVADVGRGHAGRG